MENPNYVDRSSRLIGGLPLLIIMTLNGESGNDLLDATIAYVTSLASA